MVQATNLQQYYPVQNGTNATYAPQAYNSVPQGIQQQAPYAYTNSLYQMPQASMYSQPQQQYYPSQGGANAVSINIYNPQAYGSVPQYTQQTPYASTYQMPQVPVYQQPQAYYPTYAPEQNNQVVNQQPQPVAPAPQVMPTTVMPTEPTNVSTETPTVVTPEQPVEITNVPKGVETIDIDNLVQNLASDNVETKADTINKIAEYVQDENPEIALQVVEPKIMNSLINIINEDTTSLEGPTDAQIKVAEKIAKGEQLTPEEDKLSEQLSPRDKANKNRIFALYTLAMIQKLQRDELNQYIETQKANGQATIQPLPLTELEGYNDIVNIIKNDTRPEVKIAAIQALQYIAEAQDKSTVEAVLADSLKSKNDAVKEAAQDAINQFSA